MAASPGLRKVVREVRIVVSGVNQQDLIVVLLTYLRIEGLTAWQESLECFGKVVVDRDWPEPQDHLTVDTLDPTEGHRLPRLS